MWHNAGPLKKFPNKNTSADSRYAVINFFGIIPTTKTTELKNKTERIKACV